MQPLPIVIKAESFLRKKPSTVKVLDFGAGRGRNAIYLANRGYKVLAVDKDPKSLEVIPTNHNLQTKCLDVAKWQIQGKFDCVIATNILHFFDIATACGCLDEIAKATYKNGIIVISYILDKRKVVSDKIIKKLTLYYE